MFDLHVTVIKENSGPVDIHFGKRNMKATIKAKEGVAVQLPPPGNNAKNWYEYQKALETRNYEPQYQLEGRR